MSSDKPNLLDLFVICNVPSSPNFQLFCRFLIQEDITPGNYFDEDVSDNYRFPWDFESGEGYHDNCHYKYSFIEGSTLIDGFNFGTFNSYEEAVNAAKSYTPETLLKKYFGIFEESVQLTEIEVHE